MMIGQHRESTFTSDKTSLLEMLHDIHTGKIQLPDFQRGWVWDDEHIRDLVESISLSFPIGTVMLLEVNGAGGTFKPRPIDGAPSPTERLKYLILDGQQRLTSMYHALYSQDVVQTKDPRKKPIERWYYIDMKMAIKQNGDRSEAIKSISKEKTIKNFRGEVLADFSTLAAECENSLFPLNKVFDSASWRREYNHYWERNADKSELYDLFEEEVIECFKAYLVPIIIVKEKTPKEAVCQVFEKVNTGGVSLTVFELLTATFAADNYSLRDDWLAREKYFKQDKVIGKLQSTDFLQSIALLVTYQRQLEAIRQGVSDSEIPGVGCKRKDILRLSVANYQDWADKVQEGYQEVARFLYRQKIFSARDLPYRTQIVPLAAAFAWIGEKANPDGAQQKLAQWYWSGVLGELYGSAVESRFARDFPDLVSWLQGGDLPKTIDDANFVPNRLYTLRTRNSAAYKGIHALLMRQGCQDFRTGEDIAAQLYFDDLIDIHHIFPQDWCNSHRIDVGIRNSILNKTPLSARTNRIIGGNAPSKYLPNLQERAGIPDQRMDEILSSHAIDVQAIRTDDFELFIKKREQFLLKMIEDSMGKAMISDLVNEDLILNEDYEGEFGEEESFG